MIVSRPARKPWQTRQARNVNKGVYWTRLNKTTEVPVSVVSIRSVSKAWMDVSVGCIQYATKEKKSTAASCVQRELAD